MPMLKSFLERNALALAMVIGVIGASVFRHFTCLLPPLIFLMLFFTFCKINPTDLRLRKWHIVVLEVQLALGIALYYGLEFVFHYYTDFLDTDIAIISQGLMLCVLMPTASAAAIIAGKLGGSIQNLTSFTLLSNIATAIIVPLFFPVVNPEAGIDFIQGFWMILCRITPLLICPFFAAWILRWGYDSYFKRNNMSKRFALSPRLASMPFYIWVFTLVILMGDLTYSLLHQSYSWWTILVVCVGSLLTCLLQFGLGKWIGYCYPAAARGEDYRDVLINPAAAHYSMQKVSQITAGQAFGQKNTTLAIWMAQAYLVPIASMAPAAYIIWQNIFNSVQLTLAGRRAQSKKGA